MAAIILEGPDGSGKTSLAYAIVGSILPGRGQYIKSPLGKDPNWDKQFNYWHQAVQGKYPDKLVVLDRTPEISESVYGPIVRGRSRINNPVTSLMSLNSPHTRIIMCVGSTDLEGEHTDAHGNDVVFHHIEVMGGYALVNDILIQTCPGRVWVWDKNDPDEAANYYLKGLTEYFAPFFPPWEEGVDFWKRVAIGEERVRAES